MTMTDGCSNCLKYTFGFVNLVILICGGVLLGIGITALVGDSAQLNDLLDTNLYTGVAIVITVAGGLIVLISFLGCCGAFQVSGRPPSRGSEDRGRGREGVLGGCDTG